MVKLVYPLEMVLVTGHHGVAGVGITITDRRGLALCQLMARRGKASELANEFGLSGEPGKATTNEEFTAIPLSPGNWMMIGESGRDGDFTKSISDRAGKLGYASEQSHGRTVLRVDGDRARDLMRKGCRLDLHPSVTEPGFCAQCQMAQTGVILHQIDDASTYDLIVFAGLARPFYEWLCDAAAEFGYEVAVTQSSP